MRGYLAGPMRGIPLWNFPAFDDYATWLRGAGWDIVSPADLDRDAGFTEFTETLPDGFIHEALRRDVEALLTVEAIVLMPGWQDSTGAKFELSVAENLGLDVFRIYHDKPSGIRWLSEKGNGIVLQEVPA